MIGKEAESKVPAEFQPQHREHANPPTMLLAIERLVRRTVKQKTLLRPLIVL
jgi:hypothetical protein